MKLISLNVWGGRLFPNLERFIKEKSKKTDIFCFQEVYNKPLLNLGTDMLKDKTDLYTDLQLILENFTGYFAPQIIGVGLAIFVRKGINVDQVNFTEILSAKELSHMKLDGILSYYPRIIQSLILKDYRLTIYNFHGMPGFRKKDTPERKKQGKRINEILDRDNNSKIIVGDFNLNPDTDCIYSLEKNMKNLIKECGINTTRNHHYKNLSTVPFADYCFVSPHLRINDFKVLQDEVSDHLPLYLNFS